MPDTVPQAPRPRQPSAPLWIVGHRGVAGAAPENTLASFAAALQVPVDMIELDVHLSRDGELVVMHDPHVARTTDGEGDIAALTLAELKRLNAAACFNGPGQFGVQRIPTLQEVYDLVQGHTRINIEIKQTAAGGRYPGIEERLAAFLRRNQALSYTMTSSFAFAYLEHLRELEPRLFSYGIVSSAYFAQGAGHAGEPAALADWQRHGLRGIAVNKRYLNESLMALLRQAGFFVGAWVINEPAELQHFARLGVDFVTSDRPDLLRPLV
jgi:glycerophosphoryl diester phosphodiesterase